MAAPLPANLFTYTEAVHGPYASRTVKELRNICKSKRTIAKLAGASLLYASGYQKWLLVQQLQTFDMTVRSNLEELFTEVPHQLEWALEPLTDLEAANEQDIIDGLNFFDEQAAEEAALYEDYIDMCQSARGY